MRVSLVRVNAYADASLG